MSSRDLSKSALCGEPSYVWRAGQARRLKMILEAVGDQLKGRVLENGCGVGRYVEHLAPHCNTITGMEYDFERSVEARKKSKQIINAAGENLPFPEETFSLIVSHEVLEHVRDDALAVSEMVRVLQPGGRITLFVPNRGYPFETHGIYWRGQYRFGNVPLVNWLPSRWRNQLAPHVRVYTSKDINRLFVGLPVRIVQRTIIFGAYDNLIVRFGAAGRALRAVLQWAERTPLRIFGLSHFWVVEKLPKRKS
jgi:SAM-dependent methyltransferase